MQVSGFLNFSETVEEWEEMLRESEKIGMDYKQRMDDLEQAYKDNYNSNSIKERLAQNVVQLYEYSLHDSQVTSVERRSKDTIIITLDCSGTFNEFDKLKVTFTGVSKCSIPENFEGAWWLCHEIDLAEDGFELGVLFDCPFEEVMICAKNVLLEIDN